MTGTAEASSRAPAAARVFEHYELTGEFLDEALEADGTVREHYRGVFECLAETDLRALGRTVAADLSSRGVAFGTATGLEPFTIDLVPRIVPATEWRTLAPGLAQRARALNAFAADVYSERAIVDAGVVPLRVIEGAAHYEPEMVGVPVPHGLYSHVAGLDLVRGAGGELEVLEDNLRTPSGLAYAAAARDVLDSRLPLRPPSNRRSLARMLDLLGDALRAADPGGGGDPSIVLLSDGPSNSAWFEHRVIARELRLPIVTLADLEPHEGGLQARIGGSPRPVDVVYRRTDEDRLRDEAGRPTALAEVLLDPVRNGQLACVNALGAGVGDDKLVHAYVEDMIGFYLGEEPLVESVTTYDLEQPGRVERAIERLGDLVIKPRTGQGGYGVVICAHASAEDRGRVAELFRESPAAYVAQETVAISRHPTVIDGHLEPRHVDLRPFVISSGDRVRAVPGALTRVAFGDGALVVNSSQNGGGKDTWILEDDDG